jgi:hypothetical protein
MKNWDKFRPARDLEIARRKQRRVWAALSVATALFFAVVIVHLLRPNLADALAHVAKAALATSGEDLPAPRVSYSGKRSAQRHRKLHSGPSLSRTPELGPFDTYVLDGERYIRVEGMTKYALLDTRTGEIIWTTEPR